MRPRPIAVLGVLMLAAWQAPACAQEGERLPAYPRLDRLEGRVTASGSSAVATFARGWASAFQRVYPGVQVTVIAKSSAAAISDMAAQPGTIGMTSRPLTDGERQSYAKQHGSPPIELRVAIDAVAIYVFKDNPIAAITIAQLERLFSAAPQHGPAIERWAQAGVTGPFSDLPVQGVGFERGRGAYELMRDLVLRGGDFRANVSIEPVSTSVVQAVGVDPGAIGYASVYFRTARTRTVPIEIEGGARVEPTEADAASGRYPLARYLYLLLGSGKGATADPVTRELLRFILSEEGQNITRASGAFAIPASLARAQMAALAATR